MPDQPHGKSFLNCKLQIHFGKTQKAHTKQRKDNQNSLLIIDFVLVMLESNKTCNFEALLESLLSIVKSNLGMKLQEKGRRHKQENTRW
jgi:hypothetical protein